MTLSWNEIRKRSIAFSKEWEGESKERGEAQSFWNDFFHVFGISRRRVASFDLSVKKLAGDQGFIDLFWKGTLIVEHKSKGKKLEKAFEQAVDYFPGIKEKELPRYILVSNFERLKLFDLEDGKEHEFFLKELSQKIHLFGFIAGYEKKEHKEEDPVNIKAAELMGTLHDSLFEGGYQGEPLEIFLVRILFCVFAEDSGIFEPFLFENYIKDHTHEDGSDLGLHLAQIFQILNKEPAQRQSNINEALAPFPYVNGKLFERQIPIAAFNSEMRDALIKCAEFDWSQISPAIFGSLFQSVMDKDKRRNLGAHYTSEQNILKIIKPLFLDELYREFKRIRNSKTKLKRFHQKLAELHFFDPACGCGNFLIIAYRELRLLELEILKITLKVRGHLQLSTDVTEHLSLINVDQFYGVEIEYFPAKIAEVAMWLVDHQMNQKFSLEFGVHYARLPLQNAATIIHENALQLDWQNVVPKEKISYILGNPPYVGSKYQNESQRTEISQITKNVKGARILDYVSAWYFLAANFIQDTSIEVAFVSTNSIVQGEQVGVLWSELFKESQIVINFAHRTFQWNSEARGKAAVHCVIIGFAMQSKKRKQIYEYSTPKSEPHERIASHINSYLIDAPSIVISNRSRSICENVPEMCIGNKPIDGGFYLFTTPEKEAFLRKEPEAKEFFRKWIGAIEFLQGKVRWCLWLGECPPNQLRRMQACLKRVDAVREFRLKSKSTPTKKLADTPTRFHVETIPESDYLVIPKVSSERREYIHIGYLTPEILVSDLVFIVMDSTLYHFGILSSEMHMSWVRHIAGRLKSDFRYSLGVVYNNFPWPEEIAEIQRKKVEEKSGEVLEARKEFPESNLADLYDSLSMPKKLRKAHQELDKAVDLCYRKQKFDNENQRIEFLFERYNKLTNTDSSSYRPPYNAALP
jgi:type I restriction-modification system DNA methylase subunit